MKGTKGERRKVANIFTPEASHSVGDFECPGTPRRFIPTAHLLKGGTTCQELKLLFM